MLYLILGMVIVSWSIFINLTLKERRLESFYLKGLTSFTFIFLYAYGVYHYLITSIDQINESKIVLIVAIGLGLVMGLLGDLFLEVQYFFSKGKIKQIKYGMIVFGIGHLFYIGAMTELIRFNPLSLVIGLFMTLVTYIGAKGMKLDFEKLKIYVYGYSFVIFTMMGQSIFQAIELNANTFSMMFLVGAIFFSISDLLLAPVYFKKETSKLFVIANLGTYYLGQTMIAFSIFFLT
ncbi:MAG: lysoplasmalogenase family protein [Candidatus Izemoplasmatales bacterium]